MSVKVTTSRSALDALMKDVEQIARASVTVGYHEPTPVKPSVNPFAKEGEKPRKRATPSITVPELAAIQEYGTAKIPSRPFMRRALQTSDELLARVAGTEFGRVADNEISVVRAMDAIGDAAAGRVLDTLESAKSWAIPNAPLTAEIKGHDVPLLGVHGQLREELTYAVYDGERQLLLERPRS